MSLSLTGVPPTCAADGVLRVSPNPANDFSTISFANGVASHVRIDVKDVSGRSVLNLLDSPLAAGEHTLRWDGRDARGARVPPGTYFVVVRADGRVSARRVVFVR